jgi:hypothetical protein
MRAYLPATIAVAMLLGVAQSAQVSGQAAVPPFRIGCCGSNCRVPPKRRCPMDYI